LPADPGQKVDSVAAAVTEVSEKVTVIVREEIELAKAEMTLKASAIARGVAAIAAGAVFGVFAVTFVLLTIAWAINDAAGNEWLGFLIVMILLLIMTAGAFVFARSKLKVGAPMPDMAIDEAKKIRDTVKAGAEV
jgi:hypothetical protein